MNTFESSGIQRKPDEIVFSATIPDNFIKKEPVEMIRDKRNEKADSVSIPSW